ncbi:hypothetical protein HYV87_03230 [Candidatus Woesearchaeota archaeon]|nr:hypothetical protein [Candidatus Woesearchaeota archaeon]
MNHLDLYPPGEVVLPYDFYRGKLQEKLSLLPSEHRSPMSASDFAKRLKDLEAYPGVLERWNNLCPTLGDVIARLPEYPFGSAKIVSGNPRLWDYIARSEVRDGVIELKNKQYNALNGLLIPGIRLRKNAKDETLKEDIFSYLGISAEGKELCLPKARDYTYLTLLAFNNSAKVLGSSRMDDEGCLIGVKEPEQDWVSIWLDSI